MLSYFKNQLNMAKICDVSGKKRLVGNNVSFSNKKTKRTFDLNLQKKRFFLPEENRWISLKVTANVIKTINKKGISAVIKEARKRGVKI